MTRPLASRRKGVLCDRNQRHSPLRWRRRNSTALAAPSGMCAPALVALERRRQVVGVAEPQEGVGTERRGLRGRVAERAGDRAVDVDVAAEVVVEDEEEVGRHLGDAREHAPLLGRFRARRLALRDVGEEDQDRRSHLPLDGHRVPLEPDQAAVGPHHARHHAALGGVSRQPALVGLERARAVVGVHQLEERPADEPRQVVAGEARGAGVGDLQHAVLDDDDRLVAVVERHAVVGGESHALGGRRQRRPRFGHLLPPVGAPSDYPETADRGPPTASRRSIAATSRSSPSGEVETKSVGSASSSSSRRGRPSSPRTRSTRA